METNKNINEDIHKYAYIEIFRPTIGSTLFASIFDNELKNAQLSMIWLLKVFVRDFVEDQRLMFYRYHNLSLIMLLSLPSFFLSIIEGDTGWLT